MIVTNVSRKIRQMMPRVDASDADTNDKNHPYKFCSGESAYRSTIRLANFTEFSILTKLKRTLKISNMNTQTLLAYEMLGSQAFKKWVQYYATVFTFKLLTQQMLGNHRKPKAKSYHAWFQILTRGSINDHQTHLTYVSPKSPLVYSTLCHHDIARTASEATRTRSHDQMTTKPDLSNKKLIAGDHNAMILQFARACVASTDNIETFTQLKLDTQTKNTARACWQSVTFFVHGARTSGNTHHNETLK
jgi:hypothetical protein